MQLLSGRQEALQQVSMGLVSSLVHSCAWEEPRILMECGSKQLPWEDKHGSLLAPVANAVSRPDDYRDSL